MRNKDSEFTDLSRAEVEALKECFDFLRNGYIQVIDFFTESIWVIKMRHQSNGNRLTIWIKKYTYTIYRNGETVKTVFWRHDTGRYRLSVDSEMKVKVDRIDTGGVVKFISG